ncbi:MAG: hypothetical protein HOJ79_09645 [Nitrospina sp.]|nr:hypothetical protein [Nitrospina sp.]
MNTSTDNQSQSEPTAENTRKNSGEEKKEIRSGKSNSELMAEFFSVNSNADEK